MLIPLLGFGIFFLPLVGIGKGVIRKGVFSLKESLESLISLTFEESAENGRILLFSTVWGSPESLDSLEAGPF